MSQSHKNRAMPKLRSTPLYTDAPINESTPNWAAYRLSLDRMKALQSESTHWRVTCSFPAHGVDYRDYVRANFTEFDPVPYKGFGLCKKTEYMNVRGHDCTGCTSAWWQPGHTMLHHDSYNNKCEFGSTPGFVYTEDNFGYYMVTNPSFRCSSSDDATTNHWFGNRVAWIIKNKILGGPLPICNPGGGVGWGAWHPCLGALDNSVRLGFWNVRHKNAPIINNFEVDCRRSKARSRPDIYVKFDC